MLLFDPLGHLNEEGASAGFPLHCGSFLCWCLCYGPDVRTELLIRSAGVVFGASLSCGSESFCPERATLGAILQGAK